MIFVKYEDCSGCGVCLDACTFDAILLQNEIATIDQDLCEGCQACIEVCPQGAILLTEEEPLPDKVLMMAEPIPEALSTEQSPASRGSFLSMALPAIGSVLHWTSREIVPRLANTALNYLDQRISSSDQGITNQNPQLRGQRSSMTGSGRKRRRRQRRNRRS